MSLLMWGVVYQGYNAIFPSFYPEMFPTRTRVSTGMAISQNRGTLRLCAASSAICRSRAARVDRHSVQDRLLGLRRHLHRGNCGLDCT